MHRAGFPEFFFFFAGYYFIKESVARYSSLPALDRLLFPALSTLPPRKRTTDNPLDRQIGKENKTPSIDSWKIISFHRYRFVSVSRGKPHICIASGALEASYSIEATKRHQKSWERPVVQKTPSGQQGRRSNMGWDAFASFLGGNWLAGGKFRDH